jgi:hypothetical protein
MLLIDSRELHDSDYEHEQELKWMGDRVVDCARLESVCAERHRGFESPPIRFPRRTSARTRMHNSFT